MTNCNNKRGPGAGLKILTASGTNLVARAFSSQGKDPGNEVALAQTNVDMST